MDISPDILEKAIQWHIHLHSAEATAEDRTKFETWRDQAPAHLLACQRLEGIWGQFYSLEPRAARFSLESVLGRRSRKPSRKGGTIALGLAAAIAVGLAYNSQPAKVMLADHVTTVGAQKTLELPDNSRITLNTGTALDIDFNDKRRLIRLHQGEVLVTVAPDTARPLIVETEHGTARALGTKFNVLIQGEGTEVSVVESVVQACGKLSWWRLGEPKCVTLSEGQGTRLINGMAESPQPVDPEAISSWSTGMLAFDNQPLDRVLRELQRYTKAEIRFDPLKLDSMRVSGVLPADDVPRALALLSERLPIRVGMHEQGTILVQPR
jgi:transmembrane sensor